MVSYRIIIDDIVAILFHILVDDNEHIDNIVVVMIDTDVKRITFPGLQCDEEFQIVIIVSKYTYHSENEKKKSK